MTTLAAACTEVYALTNRPDLISKTQAAVRAATLKAHQIDFFARDLKETGIQWDVPGYVQSLAYTTLWPRLRALKYLRKVDDTGLVPGQFFTTLNDPEQILDSYRVEKENVCYLAGTQLEIRSNTKDKYMLIGYYEYPDVTEAGYSSWIADTNVFVIAYEAAAIIFKSIGFDEQSAAMRETNKEFIQLLRVSNTQLVGY